MPNNLYEVLGVAPSASPETIHDAYRAMARAVHPDAVGASEDTQTHMALVNEAWRVLGDERRRRAYDVDNGFRQRSDEPSESPDSDGAPIPPSSPVPAIIALGAGFGAILMAVGFASSATGVLVFGLLLLVVSGVLWMYYALNAMRPHR